MNFSQLNSDQASLWVIGGAAILISWIIFNRRTSSLTDYQIMKELNTESIKIKKKIGDLGSPSLEQMKTIERLKYSVTKKMIDLYVEEEEKKRILSLKEEIWTDSQKLQAYLDEIYKMLEGVQRVTQSIQLLLISRLSIPEDSFQKYREELFKFSNIIQQENHQRQQELKKIAYEDAKRFLNFQIELLRRRGAQITQLIVIGMEEWSAEKKAQSIAILHIFITDILKSKFKNFDKIAYNFFKERGQDKLKEELLENEKLIWEIETKVQEKYAKNLQSELKVMSEGLNQMLSGIGMGFNFSD